MRPLSGHSVCRRLRRNRVLSGHRHRFSGHSFIHTCTCKCMCVRTQAHCTHTHTHTQTRTRTRTRTHARTRTHTHTHTHTHTPLLLHYLQITSDIKTSLLTTSSPLCRLLVRYKMHGPYVARSKDRESSCYKRAWLSCCEASTAGTQVMSDV